MFVFFHQYKLNFLCRNFLPFALPIVLTLAFSVAAVAQEDDEDDAQTQAIAVFNRGQDAHEKGDLTAAIKLYDEAIKLAPEFPEAEFQRANASLALGNRDEAEKSFRRAIELRADWTLPMASLGSLLVERNNFAEAEKFLTKAVELDRQNSPAYVALAELRLKTRAAPETLKPLLANLQNLTGKANPTASVWAARGAVENALGDKAAAKKSLANALAAEPKNSFALTTRAEISLSESDFTLALTDAKTLVESAPNSLNSKLLLARVQFESGNRAEALKILDSLDAANPNVAALRNSIMASGAANVAELEKQLETDAKNSTVLGRLCTLLRIENPAKALEYCRRANEADPTNANHAVGFGAALVQAKQYENAVAVFDRILKVAPDNTTARANRATALFQLKRYAEAKAEYQWLAERQPKLAITYYFLAIAHDNLGEYMDAMANYQQFLRLADSTENRLEIDRVNLRLPILQKQIKDKKGKGK